MLSEALAASIEQIRRCQNDYPEVYREFNADVNAIVYAMESLLLRRASNTRWPCHKNAVTTGAGPRRLPPVLSSPDSESPLGVVIRFGSILVLAL